MEETGLDVVLLNDENPDYVSEVTSHDKHYIIKTSSGVPVSSKVSTEKENIVSHWFPCGPLLDKKWFISGL